MTSATGHPTSDSVNLGSNPSSPATTNADVSGTSRASGAAEISEQAEQTAHTGRTEVGTDARARYRAEIDRLNRATDAEIWHCDHSWVNEFGPHGSAGGVVTWCVRCGARSGGAA